MKNTVRILAVMAICALAPSWAQAALTDIWGFENGAATTPDQQQFTASSSTVGGSVVTTPAYAGTHSLSLGNNNTFAITLNPTGLGSQFTLNFEGQQSGGATAGLSWSYATSGGTGGGSGNLTTTWNPVQSSWTAGSVDLSSITLGSATSITFTATAAHSLYLDNVNLTAVSAVPEPIAYALPLFGLLFIGGTAGRHYLGRLRKA